MIICGFDVETNGLKPGDNRVTEIGMQIVDWESPQRMTWNPAWGCLAWDETYPPQSDLIVKLTGITDEDLKSKGAKPNQMWHDFGAMLVEHGVEVMIAHNAQFDKGFFTAEITRYRDEFSEEQFDYLMKIPWVCTMRDIVHPSEFKCRKLAHLALDYGVAVDPEKMHRATEDVNVMMMMCLKAHVDWGKLLGRSSTPWVVIRAMIPPPFGANSDGGAGKEKAKTCGFGYQKAPGTDLPELKNAWLKRVKQDEVASEEEKLGYKVSIVS